MLKDIKISITKLQNKSGSSSLRANITSELSLLFNPKTTLYPIGSKLYIHNLPIYFF